MLGKRTFSNIYKATRNNSFRDQHLYRVRKYRNNYCRLYHWGVSDSSFSENWRYTQYNRSYWSRLYYLIEQWVRLSRAYRYGNNRWNHSRNALQKSKNHLKKSQGIILRNRLVLEEALYA